MLPPPPPRPAHFSGHGQSAWHYYDTAKSSVNSDGEEVGSSDTEDSEDGAISEFSLKKSKGKKRRKSPAKKKQEESYKKTKAADKLEEIQRVELQSLPTFMLYVGDHEDGSHLAIFKAYLRKLEVGITALH